MPNSARGVSLPPVASATAAPGPQNSAPPISQPDTYRVTRSQARRIHTTYREEYDALPEAPAPLPHNNNQALLNSLPNPHVPRSRIRLIPFETPADSFGRYRVYPSVPQSIPDSNCVPAEFSDQSFSPETTNPLPSNLPLNEAIAPCPNLSTFYFLHWFWNGGNKSIASREELRTNVILNPRFDPRELDGVDLRATDRRLEAAASSQPGDELQMRLEGWAQRTVSLRVPMTGKARAARSKPEYLSVSGTCDSVIFILFYY